MPKTTKTGKPMRYKYLDGKGKLSDNTIGHLVRYMGAAIERANHYGDDGIERLRQDIRAILTHVSSTDDHPNHEMCPKGRKS